MKWITDALSDARQLALAPVSNTLCLAGVLLALAAFVDYNKANGLAIHGSPAWTMLLLGLFFAAVGVGVFVLTQHPTLIHTRLDYDKGVYIKRAGLSIVIKKAEIQKLANVTCNSAIVLPANTTFADDCATDKRSALGAFFMEHFPADVASLPTVFAETLQAKGMIPTGGGQYPPGTTILLPERFSKPGHVLITSSTIRHDGQGISSNPHIICYCVEAIFAATADHRIDTVYMPILGSGHGGVDRGMALLFLVLAILHASRAHHHLKNVVIVVHPVDVEQLNQSKELRQIVAL